MEENLAISIGKIAKSANVSIDTLRHYAAIGLLLPKYISDTGYRYYHPSQREVLLDIMQLKAFGFSLEEIKTLLGNDEKTRQAQYRQRYLALMQEKERVEHAMSELAKKIGHHEEEI